ncbi:hypothetical protein [Streptomyces sp. NBC_00892]|uniref:hypothetical protein n=1 Tax=Streptomyces sp. NBC_00892 TaxID=2975861 RepID=UPI0022516D3B|nr:hypothetical protein [Streptomyces sp. NBC_00892]MCX4902508.1 hypothetical protein [Streptomyces sp. NBC_00892]
MTVPLEQIGMWSGAYMPFGGSFSVNTADATPAGREWVRRVQKSEPTAIHQVWESEVKEVTGTFTDPVTGAPVITKKGYYMFRPSDEVTFHSYAPRSLPAGSEIKEIILDNPIWVRVQDGTLYPAPTMDAPGLSWGYTGSGPGALATLIGRLLDDGAAHALTYGDKGDVLNGEPKLEKFLQLKHQTGTRLNRRLLENVRANGPDKLSLLTRLGWPGRGLVAARTDEAPVPGTSPGRAPPFSVTQWSAPGRAGQLVKLVGGELGAAFHRFCGAGFHWLASGPGGGGGWWRKRRQDHVAAAMTIAAAKAPRNSGTAASTSCSAISRSRGCGAPSEVTMAEELRWMYMVVSFTS